jgi:hypothetical protein
LCEEACDEPVVARMAQIEQALAAMKQRCAPATEGEAARVVDEDVSGEPMRPAPAPRAQTEVTLFPVTLAKHCGIQSADIEEAVAPQIKTKSHSDGNLDAHTGMC